MTRHRLNFARLSTLLMVLILSLSFASAQQRGPKLEPLPLPELSLMDQAQAAGSVAVIVELLVPYQSEGGLTAEAALAQRAAIDSARATILADTASYGTLVRANSSTWSIPFMALRVTPDGLAALQRSRAVLAVYPDTLMRPTLNSSLPLQDVPQAHGASQTGVGAVVAVLDTGVMSSHEFLSGQVIAEACFSQNYNPEGAKSICPSGLEVEVGAGAANPSKCLDVEGCAHGTHVAGIVAGTPIDPPSVPGGTISGIAPGAKVYAIQVFSEFTNFNYCAPDLKCVLSYTSDMIAGLQQVKIDAALYNIAAANMSIGGGLYKDFCDASQKPMSAAINALYTMGIATVISSGNSGSFNKVSSPGCIKNAITVGSATDLLDIAFYTNSNKIVDLWAIGSDVYSSVAAVANNTYESYDGTSMAAPTVAGAWAVIKAIRPSASVPEVLQMFNSTGFAIIDVNGINRKLIQLGDAAAVAAGLPASANLLTDDSFEGALVPRVSAWSQSLTAVSVLCDSAHSRTGSCYANANAGTKSKLSQKVLGNFASGKQVTLTAYLSGLNAVKGYVKVTITYNDGTIGSMKLRAQGTFAYTKRTVSLTLKQKATAFKVTIQGTTSGTFYVDDLTLTVD